MSENTPRPDDETQPVRAESAPPAPNPAHDPAHDPASPAAARRGFRERFRTLRRTDRDRGYGLAALIASALAGVIVGGLGWASVSAVVDDHRPGRDGWGEGWVQRDDRGPGERGPMHGGPRGVPGQLPPTTAPEDDEGLDLLSRHPAR